MEGRRGGDVSDDDYPLAVRSKDVKCNGHCAKNGSKLTLGMPIEVKGTNEDISSSSGENFFRGFRLQFPGFSKGSERTDGDVRIDADCKKMAEKAGQAEQKMGMTGEVNDYADLTDLRCPINKKRLYHVPSRLRNPTNASKKLRLDRLEGLVGPRPASTIVESKSEDLAKPDTAPSALHGGRSEAVPPQLLRSNSEEVKRVVDETLANFSRIVSDASEVMEKLRTERAATLAEDESHGCNSGPTNLTNLGAAVTGEKEQTIVDESSNKRCAQSSPEEEKIEEIEKIEKMDKTIKPACGTSPRSFRWPSPSGSPKVAVVSPLLKPPTEQGRTNEGASTSREGQYPEIRTKKANGHSNLVKQPSYGHERKHGFHRNLNRSSGNDSDDVFFNALRKMEKGASKNSTGQASKSGLTGSKPKDRKTRTTDYLSDSSSSDVPNDLARKMEKGASKHLPGQASKNGLVGSLSKDRKTRVTDYLSDSSSSDVRNDVACMPRAGEQNLRGKKASKTPRSSLWKKYLVSSSSEGDAGAPAREPPQSTSGARGSFFRHHRRPARAWPILDTSETDSDLEVLNDVRSKMTAGTSDGRQRKGANWPSNYDEDLDANPPYAMRSVPDEWSPKFTLRRSKSGKKTPKTRRDWTGEGSGAVDEPRQPAGGCGARVGAETKQSKPKINNDWLSNCPQALDLGSSCVMRASLDKRSPKIAPHRSRSGEKFPGKHESRQCRSNEPQRAQGSVAEEADAGKFVHDGRSRVLLPDTSEDESYVPVRSRAKMSPNGVATLSLKFSESSSDDQEASVLFLSNRPRSSKGNASRARVIIPSDDSDEEVGVRSPVGMRRRRRFSRLLQVLSSSSDGEGVEQQPARSQSSSPYRLPSSNASEDVSPIMSVYPSLETLNRSPLGRSTPGFLDNSHELDPVQQIEQIENDEAYARMLQAEFDAEVNAAVAVPPPPHLNVVGERSFPSGRTGSSVHRRYSRNRNPSPRAVAPPGSYRSNRIRQTGVRSPNQQSLLNVSRHRSNGGRSRGAAGNDGMTAVMTPTLDTSHHFNRMIVDFQDNFMQLIASVSLPTVESDPEETSRGRSPRAIRRRPAARANASSDDTDIEGFAFESLMTYSDDEDDYRQAGIRPGGGITGRQGLRRRSPRGRRFFGTAVLPTLGPNQGNDYEELLELAERLGHVSRGLNRTQINRLPTNLYGRTDGNGQCARSTECHICMSEYENGERLRILPCFHDFHTNCIDRWLREKNTCPVCRLRVQVS